MMDGMSQNKLILILFMSTLASAFLVSVIRESVIEVGEKYGFSVLQSYSIAFLLMVLGIVMIAGRSGLSHIRRKVT